MIKKKSMKKRMNYQSILSPFESFQERNLISLKFNQTLKQLTKENNWDYFDINQYLSGYSLSKGIMDRFIPPTFDHHITDSVETRKAHLAELSNIL